MQLSGAIARSVARWRILLRQERAAIAGTFALLAVPLVSGVALAVDYALFVDARIALQNAADEAALAGATVYSQSTQASAAQTAATNAFNAARLPGTLTAGTPSVTTNASGTINPNLGTQSAYTVTVTDTAQITAGFIRIFRPSVSITVSATAANPLAKPSITFGNINSTACDGNSAYLYLVPSKSGGGFDYSSVPSFSVATGSPGHYVQGNYYEIGTSYAGSSSPYSQLPAGQTPPTITANQPLGFMLRNDTNGNTGNSSCGAAVTGANSWGAPNGASQALYSSLIKNNSGTGSPSDLTNYTYKVAVTSTTSRFSGTTITGVSTTLPASILYPSGTTINEPIASSSYNNLWTYLGINNPSSGYSNCTSTLSGSTTTYTCQTQYRTSATSSTPNCALYIQSGVTQAYVSGLSNSSPSPSAAVPHCFTPQQGGSDYAAPTCAQISALASGTGSTAIAPAIVIWWDDTGGVTPAEQYYGPSSHCSTVVANGPGYGEDCQYHNNFFAIECTTGNGGSGTGLTAVVLTQ